MDVKKELLARSQKVLVALCSGELPEDKAERAALLLSALAVATVTVAEEEGVPLGKAREIQERVIRLLQESKS